MNNGAKSRDPSFKQLGSLAGFMVDFLGSILNFDQVSYWLSHKTELKQKLREVFSLVGVDEFIALHEEWQKFYKEYFNWDVDFSMVVIPPRPTIGEWRLLIIARGMTNNKMFERCEQLFKCWRYTDDLNTAVPTNARTPTSHYAVWVLDGVEPDAEFLGKSTREADPHMEIGETLLERLTHGLRHYTETGEHLDKTGLTFCSGSRDSAGDVPSVNWNPGNAGMRVGWYGVDGSHGRCGIRRAVSA